MRGGLRMRLKEFARVGGHEDRARVGGGNGRSRFVVLMHFFTSYTPWPFSHTIPNRTGNYAKRKSSFKNINMFEVAVQNHYIPSFNRSTSSTISSRKFHHVI